MPTSIKTHKKSDLTQASISSPIKVRNPGIDLGRIISMYGIIIHHILLWGRGASHFHQYKELRYLDIVINWHVNDFIFISGYVGYKTTKYSNLFYLWLCTLFYSLGIIKYFSIYKPNLYKKQRRLPHKDSLLFVSTLGLEPRTPTMSR